MKKCSQCKKDKSNDHFQRTTGSKCRECHNKNQKKYRDKLKAYQKKQYGWPFGD